MATINHPRLIIAVDAAHGKGTVMVKCKLNFSPGELDRLGSGNQFSLDCAIYTLDEGFSNESEVFAYHSKIFSAQDLHPMESVMFTREIDIDEIEEETAFWETDEIYGKLHLKNLHSGLDIPAKTHLVVHEFVS